MPTLQAVLDSLIKDSSQLWTDAIAQVQRNRKERGENPVLRIYSEKVGEYLKQRGYTYEDMEDSLSRRQDKLNSAFTYHQNHAPMQPDKVPASSSAVPPQTELKKQKSLFDRIEGITEAMLIDPVLLKKHVKRAMTALHPDRQGGVLSADYKAAKELWDIMRANQIDYYKSQLIRAGIPLLSRANAPVTQNSAQPSHKPPRSPLPPPRNPDVSTQTVPAQTTDRPPLANTAAADLLNTWEQIWSGIRERAIAEGDERQSPRRFNDVINIMLQMDKVSAQAVRDAPQMAQYMSSNPKSPLTIALRILSGSTLNKAQMKELREDDSASARDGKKGFRS